MKSIKTSLASESKWITIFIIWFVAVLIVALISTKVLPNQLDYLGGGLSNYLKNPLFWGFSNFDGEHYIAIARNGYAPLQHFFFPVYPLAVRFMSHLLGNTLFLFTLSGILVSFLSTLFFILGLTKLLRIDYSQKIAERTLLLLITFPASFYFFMVYTESIFLLLSVWCFYFARKQQFLLAALLAAIASATKVIGFSLSVALLFELIIQNWPNVFSFSALRKNMLSLTSILFSSSGLIIYMSYLYKSTGDPLVFLHKVSIFGDQRSSLLIPLPQVFYRYIFKILPYLGTYWPTTFTTIVEFLVGTSFLVIILLSFRSLRKSYWIYLTLGYLIPTLAGSFSSIPRYVIVLFPAFLYLAIILEKQKKLYHYAVFATFAAIQFFCMILFFRGYWFS